MSFEKTLTSRAVHVDDRVVDAARRDLVRLFPGEDFAGHGQDLARHRVGHRLGQQLATQAADQMSSFLLNL